MDMLTISHVSKSFGSHEIIKDLSFSVPEHSVFGFIGQNGAGKTTTMKMILGLLTADSGEIMVNGEKVTFGQNKTNQFIGYLPDVPEFYSYMTPKEYLTLCGEITGMEKSEINKKADEMLKLVGLDKANKRIQGFSRGMKQRLGIAQALMNSPKLLICDEPTSALDPVGRKEILDILLAVKEHTTVIFSTHILSDVERICDEIAFLHNGSIAVQGKLDEIRAMRRDNGFVVEFQKKEDADVFVSCFADCERINDTELLCPEKSEEDMLKAMQFLVEKEITPLKLEMLEPTLESLFMEVIGADTEKSVTGEDKQTVEGGAAK